MAGASQFETSGRPDDDDDDDDDDDNDGDNDDGDDINNYSHTNARTFTCARTSYQSGLTA